MGPRQSISPDLQRDASLPDTFVFSYFHTTHYKMKNFQLFHHILSVLFLFVVLVSAQSSSLGP